LVQADRYAVAASAGPGEPQLVSAPVVTTAAIARPTRRRPALRTRTSWPMSCALRPSAERSRARLADVELSEDEFGDLVEQALDGIPPDLGRLMRNVAIVVEDYGGSPNLLGLYHGVPLTKRTTQYSGVLPDRIAIYRLPILARCRTHSDVVRQVQITVVHEIAHHFGIDDDRLGELGWA